MKFWCCLFLTSALALGCGGPAPKTGTGPQVTDANAFKERLKFISESGGTGSALAGIEEMAANALPEEPAENALLE